MTFVQTFDSFRAAADLFIMFHINICISSAPAEVIKILDNAE